MRDTPTAGDSHPDPDGDSDTGTEAIVDLDRDGVPEGEDCDDRDPDAYPGNTEVWDGVDNDCDGRVDGRGRFTGAVDLVADAIVEGRPVRVTVGCTGELDRAAVVVAFEVRCEVPDTNAAARRLLGAVLTVSPVENVATDGEWRGTTRVLSSDGWDAGGNGAARWSADLDAVDLSVSLDAASLAFDAAGTLVHHP